MKDDKSINITSIIESSMVELKKNNEEAYELIIKKSKDGFFENHQTAGSLKSLAKDILDISLK
jgi:hypothetical protein